MLPCGCLGAWACPRGCWETCTGEDNPGDIGYLNGRRSPQGMLKCLSLKSSLGDAERPVQVKDTPDDAGMLVTQEAHFRD